MSSTKKMGTTKTTPTWATGTTGATSQGILSSNVSTEENKPTQTVSYSNSDEKDPFQNNTFETKKKKSSKSDIVISYLFTVAYHLALWTALAAIGFPFFLYYSSASATGKPSYYGYGSLIGIYPKLNLMAPYSAFNEKDRLIHVQINKSNPASYQNYKTFYQHNESVIGYYNYDENEGIDCLSQPLNGTGKGKFCAVKLDNAKEYGNCSEFFVNGPNGYYYDFDPSNYNSTPCLMLKFNKILDYIPYRNQSENCQNEPDCCNKARIEIKCEPKDIVKVYPTNGVSICQWPFKEKNLPYHSPMAMLQIHQMPNASTTVTCYAELEEGEDWKDKEDFFKTGPHTLTFKIDP